MSVQDRVAVARTCVREVRENMRLGGWSHADGTQNSTFLYLLAEDLEPFSC